MTNAVDVARLGSLAPLERGVGTVIGLGDFTPLPPARLGYSPRAALEDVVLQALQRPPCMISFSGGRDSSAVLALAARVARREGLPLPVPVSLVFPDCQTADEHEWQEMVIRHLGLRSEWQRLVYHDEMDIVGPIAAPVLHEKGTLWPFNAFFHVPIMDLAAGGSVLSGAFGDEILSSGWEWRRENLVLQRLSRPRPADAARIVVGTAPPRVRSRFLAERARRTPGSVVPRPTWLRPAAFEQVLQARAEVRAQQALSFRKSVTQALWQLRSRVIGQASMESLARDRDVMYVAPFAEPSFMAALLAERGWRMYPSRTDAMRSLFGDLVPRDLARRPTKAWFDTAFFNVHARSFARVWDGSGVDPAYVDPEELRRTWIEDAEPDARTYLLLQQAWLTRQSQ